MFIYTQRITSDLAIPIIRTLYKFSDRLAGDASVRQWYNPRIEFFTEYGRALQLLMKLADKKLDENKIQVILEEAIQGSVYIAFSADILNKCSRASEEECYRIEKAIDLVKLKRLMLMRYLDEFIEKERDIFSLEDDRDRRVMLYQWGFLAETNNDRLILKGYILSIIKDRPKDFVKFLRYPVREMYGQFVIDIEALDKVYGLSELRFLANSFKADESLVPEEKETIDLFLKQTDKKQANEKQDSET